MTTPKKRTYTVLVWDDSRLVVDSVECRAFARGLAPVDPLALAYSIQRELDLESDDPRYVILPGFATVEDRRKDRKEGS